MAVCDRNRHRKSKISLAIKIFSFGSRQNVQMESVLMLCNAWLKCTCFRNGDMFIKKHFNMKICD